MKITKPTQTEKVAAIAAAKAAAVDIDSSRFEVVYDHPNYHTDKRSGYIHGWNDNGWYLGNFTSHQRAVAAGARFCRIGNVWYDWGVKSLCRKCGDELVNGLCIDCDDNKNFGEFCNALYGGAR